MYRRVAGVSLEDPLQLGCEVGVDPLFAYGYDDGYQPVVLHGRDVERLHLLGGEGDGRRLVLSFLPAYPSGHGYDRVRYKGVGVQLVRGGEESHLDGAVMVFQVHQSPHVAGLGHLPVDAADDPRDPDVAIAARTVEEFGDAVVAATFQDPLRAVHRMA